MPAKKAAPAKKPMPAKKPEAESLSTLNLAEIFRGKPGIASSL
jgi:hypothetical protein